MAARGSFDRVADVYDASRGLPPDAEAAIADGIASVLCTPQPTVLAALPPGQGTRIDQFA